MRKAEFTSFSLFLSQAVWLKTKHKSEVQHVSCVTIRSAQKIDNLKFARYKE